MGYIGNQQSEGFSQVPAKQDLTGATGTSLTLTHAVASAEGIDLFINNVRQESGEAYSIAGDGVTVTLTGSVVATDDIYVVYNSLALQTSVVPDASVSTAKIIDGSVTKAKIGTTELDLATIKDSTGTNTAMTIASSGAITIPNQDAINELVFTGTDYTNIYSETTSGMDIGTTGSGYFRFVTNNSERLRIAATGKIETLNRQFGFFNHGTNVSLADDASIVINASVAGVGMLVIYETSTGSNGLYRVGYGSSAILSATGALTLSASDTDGAICVFSSGHTITIKNRVGAAKAFSIAMFMAGNTFAG